MSIRKTIALLGALTGMGLGAAGNAAENAVPSSIVINKEATDIKVQAPKPIPIRKSSNVNKGYKYRMTPKKNQRQKRKYLRQNQCVRTK